MAKSAVDVAEFIYTEWGKKAGVVSFCKVNLVDKKKADGRLN